LFPNIGPSKFISINLPENLLRIFNDDEFSELTKIKKFNASAVLDLLRDVLNPVRELKWDPDGESLPNKNWLDEIWSILNKDAENIDFSRLSTFPLLQVIKPSNMLVRLITSDPLLCIPYTPENEHTLFPLFPVLVKLKVRITNMKFPRNVNKELKKCIVECNPISIINSLERTRGRVTMKRLFEASKLLPSEYETFRKYVKDEFNTLMGK
jgi:hypothetical protein